jgi:hypothetical protein
VLSRVGYVTRLITSRCQGCSDCLLCIHFYTHTLYSCYRLQYHNYCFHYISADTGLQLHRVAPRFRLTLSFSAYVGVLRTGYETPFAKVRSHVFGNPLLRKRLVSSRPLLLNEPSVSGETRLLELLYCYNVTMEVPTPNTLQYRRISSRSSWWLFP